MKCAAMEYVYGVNKDLKYSSADFRGAEAFCVPVFIRITFRGDEGRISM